MIVLEVLRSADYVTVPWKNGGGVTQEVARYPSEGDLFDWRISIADVAGDGPFSSFPGVDRILTLIEPAAVVLTVDGVEHLLAYLEPFSFAGDAVTQSRLLAGPTRDFNLMTRRATTQGTVEIVHVEEVVAAGEGETLLAIVVSGAAAVRVSGDERVMLDRLDAVRLEGPGSFKLDPTGTDPSVAVTRLVALVSK